MKNLLILLMFFLTGAQGLLAQRSADPPATRQIKGTQNLIGFGFFFPVGAFAQTHFAGAGLDYSWSPYRFGRNITLDKSFGFIVNGGISYYAGKRITTEGYESSYGGFMNVYAMPGIMYNPLKNGTFSLTAGPALNIYKGEASAGFGVSLLSNYFLSENVTIGPGLVYKKHPDTDALWAITIRVAHNF
jgi:hypothetical protein